jgi:hypothetical protein
LAAVTIGAGIEHGDAFVCDGTTLSGFERNSFEKLLFSPKDRGSRFTFATPRILRGVGRDFTR